MSWLIMDEALAADTIELQTVGSRVRRMIASGGEGRLIAVFPRSLYFAADSDLICVGGATLGAGPLNALAAESFTTGELAVGMPGKWYGPRLHLGDSLVLDAEDAVPWHPPRPQTSSSLALAHGLATLARIIGSDVPARSIGRAIPRLVGERASVEADDLGERKLTHGLLALVTWLDDLLYGSDDPPPSTIDDMIGLGSGLTPSGDDALGGALIVLHQFGRRDVAEKAASHLLPLARARTSAIAYAHFAAAADGEGAAALHEALKAVVANAAGDLVASLQRLDRIGHSSGWDGLAGAVAALTALAGRSR
jgi:hypothetical protein